MTGKWRHSNDLLLDPASLWFWEPWALCLYTCKAGWSLNCGSNPPWEGQAGEGAQDQFLGGSASRWFQSPVRMVVPHLSITEFCHVPKTYPHLIPIWSLLKFALGQSTLIWKLIFFPFRYDDSTFQHQKVGHKVWWQIIFRLVYPI